MKTTVDKGERVILKEEEGQEKRRGRGLVGESVRERERETERRIGSDRKKYRVEREVTTET